MTYSDDESVEMLESITGYRYEWKYENGQRVCVPVRTENNELVKAPFVAIEDFLFAGKKQ